MAAFERAAPPPQPLPRWGREVRIGVDYSLRVTVDDIKTDADADNFAWFCIILGALQAADPEGDPPATRTAQEAAEKVGPQHASAYSLLNSIRDSTTAWVERGWDTPTLRPKTMAILQQAARGEPVDDGAELVLVLDAAQQLTARLGYPLLARPGAN